MLIFNIGQLLRVPELFENGKIAEVGPMSQVPSIQYQDIDAKGQVVMPGFVDCHTHLAHAGGTDGTFADRCNAVEAISESNLRASIEARLWLWI